MIELKEAIAGIFLLVLAVSGNFIAETMGCKTQKLLTENMYAKHIITFLLVYFAMDFTTQEVVSPLYNLKIASAVYILFILFTKMNLTFTVIVFILLATIYYINNYIDYYEKTNKDHPDLEKFRTIARSLFYISIILIIIGFAIYFNKQRTDYAKNWSTSKFLFGINKCKSMKKIL